MMGWYQQRYKGGLGWGRERGIRNTFETSIYEQVLKTRLLAEGKKKRIKALEKRNGTTILEALRRGDGCSMKLQKV
jgi:hypothetical protein